LLATLKPIENRSVASARPPRVSIDTKPPLKNLSSKSK
jgi:hypothetical protein